MQLSIHPDCKFDGIERFHVRAIFPDEFGHAIVPLLLSSCGYAFGCTSFWFGRHLADVHDFVLSDDGALTWAALSINCTNIHMMNVTEGIQVDMSFLKRPEGDDFYDQHGFLEAHAGRLPDNYWIEPARLIRQFRDLH